RRRREEWSGPGSGTAVDSPEQQSRPPVTIQSGVGIDERLGRHRLCELEVERRGVGGKNPKMPRLHARFQIMPAHLLGDFGGVKVVFRMLVEPIGLSELGSIDIEAGEEKAAE